MMNNINIVNNCCGCRACEQTCPIHCINMGKDEEGFLIPVVDAENCLDCGKCLTGCPQVSYEFNNHVQKTYAAINNNLDILMDSTSGGAMTALTSTILQKHGVVFGTLLDTKDWKVKFSEAISVDELERFRGSKYVQADTGCSFTKVKKYLQEGMKVAYVGTPCQVAGLYKFLANVDISNLFTIDILCHGVPAPDLFIEHVKYLEWKYKNKMTRFEFRDKAKFPNKTALRYEFGAKKIYILGRCEFFFRLFLSGIAYRKCCYECKYAQGSRVGDISLGDYWGIKEHHKEFDNRNGVSLVLVNTEKGRAILEDADLKIVESKLEYAVAGNGILIHPSEKAPGRDCFYSDVSKLGYKKALKKYINVYPYAYNWILTHLPRSVIDVLAQIKK